MRVICKYMHLGIMKIDCLNRQSVLLYSVVNKYRALLPFNAPS